MATKVIKASETKDKRKKLFKWIAICLATIIVALFITGLILGLITTSNGFREFEGFDSVRIYHSHGGQHFVIDSSSHHEEEMAMLQAGLEDAQFSILRGIFEGRFTNRFEFATREVVDPEWTPDPELYDEVPPTIPERDKLITQVEMRNRLGMVTANEENHFVLYFTWNARQSITVRDTVSKEDEVVYFDRARVLISAEAGNIVQTHTIYLYVADYLDRSGIDQYHEGYHITPVQMRATPTLLVRALNDILEHNNIR